MAGDTTWRTVAPIAVDDWQFCTSDNAFDPQVKTFDRWVYEADAPDTAFVNVDAKTATVTVDFGWCAARYLVGTTWSNWTNVVPAMVIAPSAPSLVSLGTVAGDTTWRGTAPVAVDDWQFCVTDSAFDPEVKSFDQWVADADFPDTEFVTINATTATVTADFAYCAARYRVGAIWSSWTGVVDATVIPPPAIVLTSDGHGHLAWTYNFVPPSDDSQPGLPYSGINIYKSADGVTWPSRAYDGWDLGIGNRDCSGDPGYFRICVCDWDGNDVPPYSNAVYSDGL